MHRVRAGEAAIPALGLGTYGLTGESATAIVAEALAAGYRHVDTARMYGNEAAVGRGIARSAVPRADIFLTTKIWPDDFRRDALLSAAADSVRELGTEPDLLLLHWPSRDVPLEETVGALDAARERGLAAHVGVSNFPTALLARAAAAAAGPLAADQVEYHPYLDQSALLADLRRRGMALTAYCPIAKGRIADDAVLAGIAGSHGRTPAQIVLRWHVQQDGVAAIPRSSRVERVHENLAVQDFALSADEMAAIHGLARPDGRIIDPAGLAPDWDQPRPR